MKYIIFFIINIIINHLDFSSVLNPLFEIVFFDFLTGSFNTYSSYSD